jgi:hypothetical protein
MIADELLEKESFQEATGKATSELAGKPSATRLTGLVLA